MRKRNGKRNGKRSEEWNGCGDGTEDQRRGNANGIKKRISESLVFVRVRAFVVVVVCEMCVCLFVGVVFLQVKSLVLALILELVSLDLTSLGLGSE